MYLRCWRIVCRQRRHMLTLFLLLSSLSQGTFSATDALVYSPALGPYSTAINIAGDLTGVIGDCPGTWGGCAAYASQVQFHPPTGYRTRILRVYGNFIAAPKTGTPAPNQRFEVGYGLKTTAPDESSLVTYPGYAATGYDGSFLWLQDYITPIADKSVIPFNVDVSAGGLLEPDNILISQAFIALDQTGLTVHEEVSFVAIYQFERVS